MEMGLFLLFHAAIPPAPPFLSCSTVREDLTVKSSAMEVILLLQTLDGNIANGIRLIIERTASV